VRVLIKEEYDRLHKVPFPLDDSLTKEVENYIRDHPEKGFKDVEEFLRAAARTQIGYVSKN
jgi:hypothetical protein